MLKLSEVGATGCDIVNYTEGTCPGWMVNYLDDEYYNYEGEHQ